METNHQSNPKDDTSKNYDTLQSKKRKHPTNGHTDTDNTNIDAITAIDLSESTTVDDISTMDVSTYLAWVNRQAKSLPNVFVATSTTQEATSIDQTGHTAAVKEQTQTTSKEVTSNSNDKKEEPFHGSRTTLQILLSKRMDILPPPTVKHLPPHHNYCTSMLDDDDMKMNMLIYYHTL